MTKKMLINFMKMKMRKFGLRVQRLETQDFLDPLLCRRINHSEDFFFIQIGANDGVTFDPLYAFVTQNHKRVKGIVVEPMKDVFLELQENYKKYPQIITVNAALHNTETLMPFYRVDPQKRKQLPLWTKGIGSFDPHFHELSGTPSDCIIEEKVDCLSLKDLIKKYHVGKINLLQIDTEGYDFEIIRNIDFSEIEPEIIHFEHGRKYDTMSKNDLKELLNLLQQNGYHIMIETDDVVAYLHDLDNF